MASLTRQQMVAAIAAGGSVLIHGATPSDSRLVSRLEDLPPESQLAAGDEAREEAALAALDARIDALAAEKAALRKRRQLAQAQPQPAPAHVLPGTEPQAAPPQGPPTPHAPPAPEQVQPPAEPPEPPPPADPDEGKGLFGRKKR